MYPGYGCLAYALPTLLLEGRYPRVTVVLGGKDLIVNTEAVGIYLTGADNGIWETGSWKHGVWKGDGLDVRWFRELDHGQVFDKERTRGRLVGVVRRYCTQ
jgi:hypothetical protein